MATPRHEAHEHHVVAVFTDERKARAAVVALRTAGLPESGLEGSEESRAGAAEAEVAAEANRSWPIPALAVGTEGMTKGWVAGTVVGTAIGAAVGLLVGLFTLQLGWVVLGILVGAVAGATAGFVLGGSFGAIGYDQGRPPAAEADGGGALASETGAVVAFRSPDEAVAERARRVLEGHGPVRLTTHH